MEDVVVDDGRVILAVVVVDAAEVSLLLLSSSLNAKRDRSFVNIVLVLQGRRWVVVVKGEEENINKLEMVDW